MRTRILINQLSDIIVTEIFEEGGKLALIINNLGSYDFEVFDIVSIIWGPGLIQFNGNYILESFGPNYIVLSLDWSSVMDGETVIIKNVVRLEESNGDKDTTFNNTTGFNGSVNQLEIDTQGRYVCGGGFTEYKGVSRPRVARINNDGSLDTSFVVGTGFNEEPRAILPNSDGSVFIGGRFTSYNGTTANRIVKLSTNGSVDTTFDYGSGFGGTPLPYVYNLKSYSVSSFIAVGSFGSYKGVTTPGIVRILTNGDIDTTFDTGTGLFGSDFGYSCWVDTDGKILVGGQFTGYNGTTSPRLVRINPDGSIDTTFNVGTGPNGNVLDIKRDGDGYLISGGFSSYNGTSRNGIARVNLDGSLDTSTVFNFPAGAFISSFKRQANGKLIVSGNYTSYNSIPRNRLVRLNTDNTLDTTFNISTGFNAETRIRLEDVTEKIVVFGAFTQYKGEANNRILRLGTITKSLRNRPLDLDLNEDFVIPITKSLVDVKEPQKRKSDFSKTITLPGTRNNNKIFSQIYEIGVDSQFNVNLKKEVVVLQDNLQILSGYLKLESINRDDWNNITYQVKIFGEFSDIFSLLKNSEGLDVSLGDLDFTEYNHGISRQTITDSWNGIIQKDGASYENLIFGPSYSVIDTNFEPGNRTRFVLSGTHSLKVGDIVRFEMDFPDDPSVNFNESNGDHTVISTSSNYVVVNLDFVSGGTNSGVLTKVQSKGEGYVYPTINFLQVNLTDFNVNNYRPAFYVKNIVDKIFDYISYDYESNFFDTDFFKRLIYIDDFQQSIDLRFSLVDAPFILYETNPTIIRLPQFQIQATITSSIDWLQFDRALEIRYRRFNSNNVQVGPILSQTLISNVSSFVAPGIDFINPRTIFINITTPLFNLNQGDYLEIVFSDSNSVEDSGTQMVSIIIPDVLRIGLSKKVLAKDFLESLINMFNLYFEVDSFNPRKLRIEPFDNFYQLSGSKNWTNKLDISKTVTIEPISPNISKSFRWVNKEDKDLYNKTYKEVFDEDYGEFKLEQETQFNTNQTQFTTKFSSTPLVDIRTGGSLIIPTIVKDDRNIKLDAFNPRILYFTGIRYSEIFSLFNISTAQEFGIPMFGYAGHFDNPKDATIDLNFFYSREYYYGENYPFYITENTLYNKYYRNYIEEIIDKDSKILRGYFKLNSYDVNTLKFSAFYEINNQLWRLQSVKDYNPLTNEPTLCEFIKVKRSGKSITNRRVNPVSVKDTNLRTAVISRTRALNGIIELSQNNVFGDWTTNAIAVGSFNTIGRESEKVILSGTNNNVSEKSNNIFVFGNSNKIGETGLTATDIFAVGNNISVTQSSIIIGGPEDSVKLGNTFEVQNTSIWGEGLDFNFNIGTGFNQSVNSVFVSGGKILIGGFYTDFNGNTRNRLVRLNNDGTEDTAFYTNLGTGFNDEIKSIQDQSDDKILVAGYFTQFDGNTVGGLIRLNSDGTEDTAFTTNIGTGFDFGLTDVKLQSDGKILCAGGFTDFDGNARNSLIRLNTDGTEDTAFYTNLGTGFNNEITKLGIDSDGKIVCVGIFTTLNGTTRNRIVRLNTDGTVDTAFYTNLGTAFTLPVEGVTIEPNNKIICYGAFDTFNGSTRNGIVRINIDGSEDSLFYTNLGSAITNISLGERITSVLISSGKLYIGGFFSEFNGEVRECIIKLNNDGIEDTDFYSDLDSQQGVGGIFDSGVVSGLVEIDTNNILAFGLFTGFLGNTNENFSLIKNNIDSEVSMETLNIDRLLKLAPLTSDPVEPSEGDIYYRQGVGLKFYDGSTWRTINFT